MSIDMREGWFVVGLILAFGAGLFLGFASGESSRCRYAFLASHNAADSAVVARVCEVPRAIK